MEKLSLLKENVDRLFQFLKPILKFPVFSEILIVEDCNENLPGSPKTILRKMNFKKLNDFEIQFMDLLNQGFPWLNLSCLGVYKKNLILTISKPNYFPNPKSKRTSVNLSGPINLIVNDPDWNLERGYLIV